MSDPYHRGCFGAYQVQANGTLVATSQHCIDRFFGFCNFTGCHFGTQADKPDETTALLYCCCNSNECNVDSPDYHPDHPIYPTKPSHSPGKYWYIIADSLNLWLSVNAFTLY